MVLSAVVSKARELVEADSTSYTDASILINLNLWYHKVVSMILSAQDESDYDDPNHGDYPELTFPLVANQRDYSIGVSEKVLNVKRLDITYDGVNYYKAEPIDSGELGEGMGNDTTVDARFTKTAPVYDYKYGAFWIYPRASAADIAAGAQGIVQWQRQMKELVAGDITTGTLVLGFDDTWHPMVAYGAAFEYALVHQLPVKEDLAAVLVDYEQRLKAHYSRKQLDRKYQLKSAFIDYN